MPSGAFFHRPKQDPGCPTSRSFFARCGIPRLFAPDIFATTPFSAACKARELSNCGTAEAVPFQDRVLTQAPMRALVKTGIRRQQACPLRGKSNVGWCSNISKPSMSILNEHSRQTGSLQRHFRSVFLFYRFAMHIGQA